MSDTGMRRIWRVLVGRIDVEWLADNRLQLFAEAVQRLDLGEAYWDVPENEAARLQDDAIAPDDWTFAVVTYAGRFDDVRVEDVLLNALEIKLGDAKPYDGDRVRRILKLHGYVVTRKRVDNVVARVWRKSRIEDSAALEGF